MFKIEEREDINIETKRVAKKSSKIFVLQLDADTYDTRIDVLRAKSVVSPTLAKNFSEISKNGLTDTFLLNILIKNMVTKFSRKKCIPLLIDLAVMIRKKKIVEHLCEYGIVCSYDE